jgi:hypothetical protein
MQVRHRLHEARFELAQADALAKVWPARTPLLSALEVPLPLHHREEHLAVVGLIAKEIRTRGFAFDEARLLHFTRGADVIVPRPKESRAHRVDDAQRLEAHLGRDASISHPEEPPTRFFLERLMQIRFAGHVHSLQRLRYIHVIKLAATTGRNNPNRRSGRAAIMVWARTFVASAKRSFSECEST